MLAQRLPPAPHAQSRCPGPPPTSLLLQTSANSPHPSGEQTPNAKFWARQLGGARGWAVQGQAAGEDGRGEGSRGEGRSPHLQQGWGESRRSRRSEEATHQPEAKDEAGEAGRGRVSSGNWKKMLQAQVSEPPGSSPGTITQPQPHLPAPMGGPQSPGTGPAPSLGATAEELSVVLNPPRPLRILCLPLVVVAVFVCLFCFGGHTCRTQ